MRRKAFHLIATVVITFSFFDKAYAQLSVTSPTIKLYEHNPVSPNAAGLANFIETPVNMATGIPDISIPLYTIKSGRIEVPIVLRYHAGGLKVNETAGWVGMNWDLSVGGKVVKQTNGLDDVHAAIPSSHGTYVAPNYSYNMNASGGLPMNNVTDVVNAAYNSNPPASGTLYNAILGYFGRIAQGLIDGEADEYFFNVPGMAGKIFFNQKNNRYELDGLNGWTLEEQSGALGSVMLTSNTGIKYNFYIGEMSKNPLLLRHNPDVIVQPDQTYLTTGMHLAEIIDPTTNKMVTFSYETEQNKVTYAGLDMYKTYTLPYSTWTYNGEYFDVIKRQGDDILINSITYDDGQVLFIRNTNARQDQGSRELTEIRVTNRYGKIIKRIKFAYTYNTSTITSGNYTAWSSDPNENASINSKLTKRLFLLSVQEFYQNGMGAEVSQPPYTFTYNLSQSLPKILSYAQDYWGYYNGKNTNTNLLPTYTATPFPGVYPEANLEVDPAYTQLGVLTEINHPTGGKTVFEYENNKSDGGILRGGLRVKKITKQDLTTTTPIVTEYEYKTESGLESGVVVFSPKFYYEFRAGSSGSPFSFTPALRLQNNSVYPLTAGLSSPVMYSSVLEKKKGINSPDILVRHNFITYGSDDDPFGLMNFYNADANGVPHNKYPIFDKIFGKENLTKTYKTTATGTELIKEDVYSYKPLVTNPEFIWNVQGAWAAPANMAPDWCTWSGNDPFIFYVPNLFPSINAYKIIKDEAILDNSTTTNITPNGTLQTNTKLFYDVSNSNVTKQTVTNSAGDEISILTKYVTDYTYFPSATTGINYQLRLLKEANCVAFPVESIKTLKKKNTTTVLVTEAVLYEYENLRLKKIYKAEINAPVTSFTQSYNNSSGFYKDNSYSLESEVMEYDGNGNPVTISSKNKTSGFVWDNLSNITLASVINAAGSDIAYSSFESTIKGNFTYTGNTVPDPYAPTGGKVYQLTPTTQITKALNPAKQYLVTLWANNSYVTVNSAAPVITGRALNGFTLYSYLVSSNSTLTISGTATIDEVRLYPKDAMMTSYVYEPEIGMTCQNDPNNRITYYEYDAFSRLVLVRDQDKNILKKICYNYSGQPEICGINCTDNTPNWQNTSTPSRCQVDNYGQNTGYMEQEQVDVNPCSPSFNYTRWQQTSQNTTVCPLPTYVNLTSTNVASSPNYVASYYNTVTGCTYTFNVSTSSGLQSLGTVPSGNYTLSIYKTSGIPLNGTFKSGCFKQIITGTSAVFYNVGVSTSTCNLVTVDISGID